MLPLIRKSLIHFSRNKIDIKSVKETGKDGRDLKGDLIKGVFATSTMGVSYKVKLGKSI